jgi:ABC-type multidrug transport system fused ATPase/permease subunit
LIFDESTSALDNLSQEHVMRSVEELKKDNTIITIAHRLSTIEDCDIIYFIDKGKIVDSGTHKQLLKKNKKYATLYNKQKKENNNAIDSDDEFIVDDVEDNSIE